MKEKFEGAEGRDRLIRALEAQTIIRHDTVVATAMADSGELFDIKAGEAIVEQGGDDRDFFFVLDGEFDILVNGGRVNGRRYGDHIGEVAAFDPGKKRTATVKATTAAVVLRVSDTVVRDLTVKHPKLVEAMLVEANDRLAARNERDACRNDRPHVVLVSSSEGLPVAREIQSQLRGDGYIFRPWNQVGVFGLSGYPIPSLQAAMENADFVIVVAQPDDLTEARGVKKATPRDNVTFELGMAIGLVGLDRTIVLTPSDQKVDLASDVNGLTTGRYPAGDPLESALGPVAHDIRKHINERGPRR